jgi:hypothetical protein
MHHEWRGSAEHAPPLAAPEHARHAQSTPPCGLTASDSLDVSVNKQIVERLAHGVKPGTVRVHGNFIAVFETIITAGAAAHRQDGRTHDKETPP